MESPVHNYNFINMKNAAWTLTDVDRNQWGRKLSEGIYEFKQIFSFYEDYEVRATIVLANYTLNEQIECLSSFNYKWEPISKTFRDSQGCVVSDWVIAECLFEMRYFV